MSVHGQKESLRALIVKLNSLMLDVLTLSPTHLKPLVVIFEDFVAQLKQRINRPPGLNNNTGQDLAAIGIDIDETLGYESDDEIDLIVEENGEVTRISPGEFKEVRQSFVSSWSGEEIKESRVVDDSDLESKSAKDLNGDCVERLDCGYLCKLCGEMVSNRLLLEGHMKVVHGGVGMYRCSDCPAPGKLYSSSVGVLLHRENHHSDSSLHLACPHTGCSYSTHGKQLLRAHVRSHQLNSCLQCPVCGKEYMGGQQAFRAHMKLHTGDKNYKCDKCDKSFVSQSRLTHHRANVHDPPKFQCHTCSKLFKSKVNFTRHLGTHSENRDFPCDFCDYKAKNASNLTSHVKAVHKIDDFTTGKRLKSVKRDILNKRNLQFIREITNDPDDVDPVNLSKQLGSIEAEEFMKTNSDQSIASLKAKENKQNIKQIGKRKSLEIGTEDINDELVPHIVTLTNDKGDLIKAIISVGEEKVEEDGIVMEETHILEGDGNVIYEDAREQELIFVQLEK